MADTLPYVELATCRREQERVDALHRLGILDTDADERFDRLVALAAAALQVPIAAISLIDRERQWFKAKIGLDAPETPRDASFCTHAVAANGAEPFVVPDAQNDDRFATNPLVTGDPNIRFYAGQVVHGPDGHPLGTLCVIDREPRVLTDAGTAVLAQLASLVEEELCRHDRVAALLEEHAERYLADATVNAATVGLAVLDPQRRIVRCNATFAHQAGRRAEDLIGEDLVNLVHPEERSHANTRTAELIANWSPADAIERRLARPDGREMIVDVQIALMDEPDQLLVVRTIDVTERRRLLRELARYRYFFENSNDIILVLDSKLRVKEASPSLAEVLGIATDRADLGQAILAAVHPDDRALIAAELDRLRYDDEPGACFTVRAYATSGASHHLEFVASNLLGEPAVDGIVLVGRDVSERVRFTKELSHRAAHDTLTGLANRAVFEAELTRRLDHHAGGSVAVLFLDVDSLKQVNDTYGHQLGDELLAAVGARLAASVRGGDLAARLGGDEFAAILGHVSTEAELRVLAGRIEAGLTNAVRHFMTARGLGHDLGGPRPVGVSVGFALGKPGEPSHDLCKRADDALYRCKRAKVATPPEVPFQTAW